MFKDLLKLNKALDSLDVHKKHVVAVMVVDKERGKILLGKRKSDGIWTSPAGHMQGEESARQCIIREAFEEANLHFKLKDLKDLPCVPLAKGRLCHVYLANLDSKTCDIHPKNDPDAEISRWEWFDIDGKPPTPMDEPRIISFNNARMKTLGLKKGIIDQPDALIIENTQEQNTVENATKGDPWVGRIKEALKDLDYTDLPKEIHITRNRLLTLSKVDDGFYSGFLKTDDVESGNQGEVLIQLPKMTVEVIVQILRTKGYFGIENKQLAPQVAPESGDYSGLYEALKTFDGTLHLHLAKSLNDELLKNL